MPIKPTLQERERMAVETLRHSKLFVDYATAFRSTTGLALEIRAAKSDAPGDHAPEGASCLCSMMAESDRACEQCVRFRRQIEDSALCATVSKPCFAGLVETSIPIRVGQVTIAHLRTGLVLTHAPTVREFERTRDDLAKIEAGVDFEAMRHAYFGTRVLAKRQYGAMVRLLELFALQLGTVSNETLRNVQLDENPIVRRVKDFVAANQEASLSLSFVASNVHTSTFNLCRVFKEGTGQTFTEYLSRTRVESAKELLLNPHLRISEIAYRVGFQSLSQFNRIFRRFAGASPSDYRIRIAANPLCAQPA